MKPKRFLIVCLNCKHIVECVVVAMGDHAYIQCDHCSSMEHIWPQNRRKNFEDVSRASIHAIRRISEA